MRRKRFASTYSFEYFNLLERINHIRILDSMGARPLTGEERNTLIDLAHKTENLDFARIRTALSLPESSTFNMVRYQLASATQAETEKKEKFCYLKAYHEMRKTFDKVSKGYFSHVSKENRNAISRTTRELQFDRIVFIFTKNNNDIFLLSVKTTDEEIERDF